MSVRLSIGAEDVREIETKLASERSSMTQAEVSFTENLVQWVKSDRQDLSPENVEWEWTHRF